MMRGSTQAEWYGYRHKQNDTKTDTRRMTRRQAPADVKAVKAQTMAARTRRSPVADAIREQLHATCLELNDDKQKQDWNKIEINYCLSSATRYIKTEIMWHNIFSRNQIIKVDKSTQLFRPCNIVAYFVCDLSELCTLLFLHTYLFVRRSGIDCSSIVVLVTPYTACSVQCSLTSNLWLSKS